MDEGNYCVKITNAALLFPIFNDIRSFWNGNSTVIESDVHHFRHGEVGCPVPQSSLALPGI